MTWRNFIGQILVEHAGFGNLLLFFFKHCMLNHELDKIAHVLATHTGSAVFKLSPSEGRILECLLDETDVREPKLEVQIE